MANGFGQYNPRMISESVIPVPKYCAKCGKPLVSDAAYCGSCGAPIRRPVLSRDEGDNLQLRPVPPKPIKEMSTIGIAARVVAGITIAFMLMPWLSIPIIREMGQYASAIGLTGSSGQYSMFEMGKASNMINVMWGSGPFESVQPVFFIAWIAALALIAIGLIRSMVGSKATSVLAGGGAACCLVAAIWFVAIPMLSKSYYGSLEVALACYISFICGALTIVLSVTKS